MKISIHRKNLKRKICCEKGTGESFPNKSQKELDIEDRIPLILDIVNVDIVKSFFLDSMYLFHLGVGKRLLKLLISGKCTSSGIRNVNHLQELSDGVSKDVPAEFQRKTFDLSDVSNWNAMQFRFFVLYASGIVVRKVITGEKLKHFMLFFVACRILFSRKLAASNYEHAKFFLRTFYKLVPTFYGPDDSQVMNLHNLIHVVDDGACMKAPSSTFSAFDVESFFVHVKKLVKSSRNSIAQVERKIHAMESSTEQLCGWVIKIAGDIFTYPVPSKSIGIYEVRDSQNSKRQMQQIKVNEIDTECIFTEVE